MENFKNGIKLLRAIKSKLDDKMLDPYTKPEINSTDLYSYLKKSISLKEAFPTQREFNQFLREQHQNGIMKQIIPNYGVDTSRHTHYRWTFTRDLKLRQLNEESSSEAQYSKFKHHSYGKHVIASNGEKLRSAQEKFIYEKLLKLPHHLIRYDHPISRHGELVYVDFLIKNKHTNKEILWEHFGMDSEEYLDGMADKLLWYKNNGFKNIEAGGNLIYTNYQDEHSFNKNIEKYIKVILEN